MQMKTVLRLGLLTVALCSLSGITGCSSNKQEDTPTATTGTAPTSDSQTTGGATPNKGNTGTAQQRKPDM